ncbi:hypothetical protein FKM82_017319 [Ascaphus truei]
MSSLSSGAIPLGPRQDQNGAATAFAPLHNRLAKVTSVACSSAERTLHALPPFAILDFPHRADSPLLRSPFRCCTFELLYMGLLSAGQLPHQYNNDYPDAPPCVPNVGWTRVCTTSG